MLRSLSRLRRPRALQPAFVVCVSLTAVFVQAPAASAAMDRVRFWDKVGTNSTYGVHGQWDDPLINQGIDCPSSGINSLDSFVRADGMGSEYVETGARHGKNSSCNPFEYFYAEWDTGSGGQGATDIDLGISNVNHDYVVNRGSSQWYSRVDGGSSFEFVCCSSAQIVLANEERVGMVCTQDSSGGCLSVGKVHPANELTFKPGPTYSGAWPSWAGRDGECADYSRGARGNWNTSTGVQFSFNVSVSGSITGPSC